MSRLWVSCEEASLLLLKKEENKISQYEKIQLWLHLSVCELCREFQQQNRFINKNLELYFNNHEDNIELSQEQKEKMKDSLQERNVR